MNTDALAKKVLALISKYGEALTLTRRTTNAYDPATLDPAQIVATYDVKGLVEKSSDFAGSDKAFQGGESVQKERRKVSVPASGLAIVPEPGDELGPIDGKTFRIIAASPGARLQGVTIFYELKVAA